MRLWFCTVAAFDRERTSADHTSNRHQACSKQEDGELAAIPLRLRPIYKQSGSPWSRTFLPEIQPGLLMPVGMLFPPELSKEGRPVMSNELSPSHVRVACKAQCQHQLRVAIARSSVVNRYRSLSALERRATGHDTTITVTRQNRFAVATKVFLVLPLQGVASGAQPKS